MVFVPCCRPDSEAKRREGVLGLWLASGSPVPPRRTLAPGIHALRSLRAAVAFALRAALTGEAGLGGTGDPSRGVLW